MAQINAGNAETNGDLEINFADEIDRRKATDPDFSLDEYRMW